MIDAVWVGLGLAGIWVAKKLFSAAPMSGGGSVIKEPVDKLVTVLGRATYVHAPVGASRLLVFFHGHGGVVSSRGPKIAKALGDAPVALIMPQLGPKSEIGDLSFRMPSFVSAARAVVGLPSSEIDGVSHSGGYRGLAALINQTSVSGACLLDSLYGEYPTFASGKFSCLIDIYGPTTATLSEQLHKEKLHDPRYQITRTSTFHDAIPEMYIGQVARALPTCGKVTVVP